MPLNFIAYAKEQLKVYSKNSVSDSGALFWDCTEKKGKKTEKEPPPPPPYKANRKIKQQKKGFYRRWRWDKPWTTNLPPREIFLPSFNLPEKASERRVLQQLWESGLFFFTTF